MQIEFLIIGQGISGTWLSYYLNKEGRSFRVIDNAEPLASSRLAAGVINPVTGRRHVTVWMAEQILPFAQEAYSEIGTALNIQTILSSPIIDFFPSPQMKLSFMQRLEENDGNYLDHSSSPEFSKYFNYDFGFGEIKPVYTVQLETLLPAWRNKLSTDNNLIEEHFDYSQLEVNEE